MTAKCNDCLTALDADYHDEPVRCVRCDNEPYKGESIDNDGYCVGCMGADYCACPSGCGNLATEGWDGLCVSCWEDC